jgi:uncharacterized protein YjdB
VLQSLMLTRIWLKDGTMQDEDETSTTEPLPYDSLDGKIDSTTMDPSINSADILCGRGKTSFNHGKLTLQRNISSF